MFTRISDARLRPIHRCGAVASLCLRDARGEQPTDHATLARHQAQQEPAELNNGLLRCAQGAGALARTCTLDRAVGDQRPVHTIRHRNGAFHRLLMKKDGRGVIATDRADSARISVLAGKEIDVGLGNNCYRLPATMQPATPT